MVKQYLDNAREILTSKYTDFKWGSKDSGIISLPGTSYEFDLREGFPLLTTKEMDIKSIAYELMWFLKGDTNIKYLEDNRVPIWRRDVFKYHLDDMVKEGIFPSGLEKYTPEWESALNEFGKMIREDKGGFAEKWGDGGPIYGEQWKRWKYFDEEKGEFVEIDQIGDLIGKIKKNPTSKKKIVSAWNTRDIPKMSLAPCHVLFQVHGNEEGQLDLQLFQRSSDYFLGVPYNDASYSMFLQMLANETGMEARRFIHNFGDAHFYASVTEERGKWYKENLEELKKKVRDVKLEPHLGGNYSRDYSEVVGWINKNAPPEMEGRKGYDHVTAILEQLSREPRELPKLHVTKKPMSELTIDDFVLEDYNPHPAIRRKMAV